MSLYHRSILKETRAIHRDIKRRNLYDVVSELLTEVDSARGTYLKKKDMLTTLSKASIKILKPTKNVSKPV